MPTFRPSRTFVRFIVVGLINTLFGVLVLSAFLFLGFGSDFSCGASMVVGVAFNYLTYSRHVFFFRSLRRVPLFIASYLVIYLVYSNALTLVEQSLHCVYLSAAVVACPVALFTYFVNSRIVFRPSPSPAFEP